MTEKKDDIILTIRGMSKSFGRNRVLDHINMDVKRGTVMGLMGENGAGKSTMMKCLFGIYHKDEGEIILDGQGSQFLRTKGCLGKRCRHGPSGTEPVPGPQCNR
jgi:methyl-galactoside transport system ATP-binding protein